MKTKITQDGQPCRKCGTPVVKKTHAAPTRQGQSYWFPYSFYCPKCGTLYMGPRERVDSIVFETVRKSNYRLKMRGILWFDGDQPLDPDAQVKYQLGPVPKDDAPLPDGADEWDEVQLREYCRAMKKPDWVMM